MKHALIVIDVQNYFINEFTNHIPVKVAHHIEQVNYDRLIFTQFINQTNSNFERILEWNRCYTSPDIDISPKLTALTKRPNSRVINRCAYSSLTDELRQILHYNQINRLTLCGIDTDACVIATAFDIFDEGYDFDIAEELCASTGGQGLHQSGLKLLQRNLERQKDITV